MKKALVLGLGLSGKSAVKLLVSQGYQVVGVDRQGVLLDLEGVQVFQEKDFVCEEFFPLVVVSPGISREHPILKKCLEAGSQIMGEVDFALQHLHQKMVAITGTNGKTTVALLVEHVLNSAKIKAKALGNVGVSVAEYCLAPDPEEILVFELSSYQLETLDRPVFDAGVILNITPDHLDRYENLESYARAKAKLQHCLVPNGVLYLHFG
jgi:UDP-N-acetylmuramoylalanine--D-glutamate ligase